MEDLQKFETEWGYYLIIIEPLDAFMTQYQAKKLFINPNAETPLIAHRNRSTVWDFVQGVGVANIGDKNNININENVKLKVSNNIFAQLKNTSDKEYLVIIQTEIGKNLHKDDIIY